MIEGTGERYIPWKTLDLEGLVTTLPSLNKGALKWIREFENNLQGKMLAIGDLKAILARMLGATEVIRLLRMTGARKLDYVAGTEQDGEMFDPYHNL